MADDFDDKAATYAHYTSEVRRLEKDKKTLSKEVEELTAKKAELDEHVERRKTAVTEAGDRVKAAQEAV